MKNPGHSRDLGACAPPGTRTLNPLITGPIYSMLLRGARNIFISWAFAASGTLVAVRRLRMLPVESRPVSRTASRHATDGRQAM
jgi:hypothetical protein